MVPKYEMFPAGKLIITTSGSWCYIYDWGPESKNPIPNVTEVVGSWEVPGKEGGQYVLVDLESPWAVNSKAADVGLAKICKSHDIPKPPVGYWAKKEVGKAPPQPPLPTNDDPKLQLIKLWDGPRPSPVAEPLRPSATPLPK